MIKKICKLITGYFPVWVVIGSVLAFLFPTHVKPLSAYTAWYLGTVMLCMGLTMTTNDFKLVFSRPLDVLWGVVPRFLIMPFVAFAISKILHLPAPIAAGLILVGCCPSAVASNVMTFLSKGDEALSITVSSVNTVLAPVLTPALFLFLAGSMVKVNTASMLLSILKSVVIPVCLGVLIRRIADKPVQKVVEYVPVISTIALMFIITTGIAVNAENLAKIAFIAFLAVALHNATGLFLGYNAARRLGKLSKRKSKAIAFEIGMENSGLAVTLALMNLDPLCAIPGAIFSAWHNVTGSALASYWAKRADKDDALDSKKIKSENGTA
ncbi:bile acid:sodium symporter family protein [Clostridium sp. WLY-B-L2]|uniref:Bile acid:sodium symporter family protein n=1 Tax=Clostridium aromativorans TaxID=2836848 RepID=A0ABS8N608_9CLOT|nr:bile acid:sodium symporter family protein [Clostridium aromativorans]MCC9295200.1 bile acid:sodium symporter family protein [Clostridium aromativorans]CAB1247820.1 Uncharacterized sodium-dependent transporter YocS [Clostridiaceae bacterium BL-3]